MKAKTQVKIGIITAWVSAVLCIIQFISSTMSPISPAMKTAILSYTVTQLAIYFFYVYSLKLKHLLMAKCFYIIWCISVLRTVLNLNLLLQGHDYLEAFIIGSGTGLLAILLWIGISGLKRLNNTSNRID